MKDENIDSRKQQLTNIVNSLADAFGEERKKSEPYKELFKKGSTHTRLLRELESEMVSHVLDARDVYKERHGVEINTAQYNVLLALPFLVRMAQKDVKKNEGWACNVDKAFFVLSEELIKLGK